MLVLQPAQCLRWVGSVAERFQVLPAAVGFASAVFASYWLLSDPRLHFLKNQARFVSSLEARLPVVYSVLGATVPSMVVMVVDRVQYWLYLRPMDQGDQESPRQAQVGWLGQPPSSPLAVLCWSALLEKDQ